MTKQNNGKKINRARRANDRVKKSLWCSIMDGSFYSAMVGFGESFFSAFAVFLGATSMQLGLLGSLPQTLGSVSQLFSNKILEMFGNSRKRFICINAFLTALLYIPIALVYFFGTLRVYHLIIFICIYWILNAILGPAWNSWMGDLVDENKRGAYFGRRNKIAGFVSFVSLLLGGYILQQFGKGTHEEYYGFVIIFALAFVSRIFSFIYLSKQYEPKYTRKKKAEFSFVEFIRRARFTNYGLFVIYLSIMNFGVYFSGPFFAAYMLYDLKLTYMQFTIVTATALIVKFLLMPIWGKACDRYGTKKVLTLSGILMPLTPMLWIFSHNFWYLIAIQAYSGFVWAGFEISSFNFIFDTTTPEKRATCVAYYNVLSGIAIFSGAMLGGLVAKYNHVFWSSFLLVFLLSGMIRYMASFYFLPKLKEVREVKRISNKNLLLTVVTSMPTMGLVYGATTFTVEKEKHVIHDVKEFTEKHKKELIETKLEKQIYPRKLKKPKP